MKKKNSYILYCVFFSVFALCSFVMAVLHKNPVSVGILIACATISTFFLGVCATTAKQIYYYNKAMDAWAAWAEQMKKTEDMQIREKQEAPFKEFSIEYEEYEE